MLCRRVLILVRESFSLKSPGVFEGMFISASFAGQRNKFRVP
jgi:hypothetical protein